MHIESVPNRQSHPTILLRESYRAEGKVKKRTIANLTNWPEQLVEGLRGLLRGGVVVARPDEALTISRSLPHGHVAAVLGTARQVGLPKVLDSRRGGVAERRLRDLALALIVSRVIAPGSKLATVRALNPETAASSLGGIWNWVRSRSTRYTTRWTGCSTSRSGSRPRSPSAISRAAH